MKLLLLELQFRFILFSYWNHDLTLHSIFIGGGSSNWTIAHWHHRPPLKAETCIKWFNHKCYCLPVCFMMSIEICLPELMEGLVISGLHSVITFILVVVYCTSKNIVIQLQWRGKPTWVYGVQFPWLLLRVDLFECS